MAECGLASWTWKTAKQPLAPAPRDAAVPGLSSEVSALEVTELQSRKQLSLNGGTLRSQVMSSERYLVKATWQEAVEI